MNLAAPVKIHDIKPLTDIPDLSIYLLGCLIVLAIALVLTIIYLIFNFLKNKKADQKKQWHKILDELDFSNTKHAAYQITKYGRLLAVTDREIKLIEEIIHDLEENKYKKEVKPIKKSVISKFHTFMENVDV